ncbi:9445_t:CDS:2, partial [Paraglomus brasilianum]
QLAGAVDPLVDFAEVSHVCSRKLAARTSPASAWSVESTRTHPTPPS